jgi:hypothetical protein
VKTLKWSVLCLVLVMACGKKRHVPPGVPRDGWVQVPAGWAVIGCLGTWNWPYATPTDPTVAPCTDRNPPRRVWISSFEIQAHPALALDYARCVRAGHCSEDIYADGGDYLVPLSRKSAVEYCRSMGARLPTSAEWEKAARAGDRRLFPWGETPPTCKQAPALVDSAQHHRGPCTWYGGDDLNETPATRNPIGLYELAIRSQGELTSDSFRLHGETLSKNTDIIEVRDGDVIRLDLERSNVAYGPWALQRVDPKVAEPTAAEPEAFMSELSVKESLPIGQTQPGDEGVVRCVRSIPGPPPPVVAPLPEGRYRAFSHDGPESAPL